MQVFSSKATLVKAYSSMSNDRFHEEKRLISPSLSSVFEVAIYFYPLLFLDDGRNKRYHTCTSLKKMSRGKGGGRIGRDDIKCFGEEAADIIFQPNYELHFSLLSPRSKMGQ